jgi:hypothetical protein
LRLVTRVIDQSMLEIDRRLMELTAGIPTIAHHELPRYADGLTLVRQERQAMSQMMNAIVLNLRIAVALVGAVVLLDWCTCAGTIPSPNSPPSSASPSAPPTPTRQPSSTCSPNRAPGLLRALREADLAYVLLDGTLAECDRVGDSRADFSHKHRRHGVNVQVVTDPVGQLLWVSPAMPGRAHDLTAARAHRIIWIFERQGVPVLAERAYMGAGSWVMTPLRRPPGRALTPTQQTVNRALSTARAPVERGVARLKSWRISRRSWCSPNRMSSISAVALALERQR